MKFSTFRVRRAISSRSWRFCSLLFLLAAVLSGLIFGCGGGGGPASNTPSVNSAKPRNNTRIISAADGVTVTREGANTLLLTGRAPRLQIGDVLVTGLGGGALGSVQSVNDVARGQRVALSPATLEDAFSEIHLHQRTRLTAEDLRLALAHLRQQNRLSEAWSQAEVVQTAGALEVTLPIVLEDLDKNDRTEDDQLVLEVTLTIDCSPFIDWDTDWLRLNKLVVGMEFSEFRLRSAFKFKGAMGRDTTLALSLAQRKVQKELALLPPIRKPFAVGPVIGTFEVTFKAITAAKLDWGLQPELGVNFTGQVGLSYEEGSMQNLTRMTAQPAFALPFENSTWLDKEMSVEAGLQPALAVYFGGTVGPKVETNFMLAATGRVETYPARFRAEFVPYIDGKASIDVKWLGKRVAEVAYDFEKVNLASPRPYDLDFGGNIDVGISRTRTATLQRGESR